jgi:uncharacterized membrane protein (UPF0127 family)
MTLGRLVASSGKVVVDPCMRTTNTWDRLRGLLLRQEPPAGAGLLIDRCASVHTFFMSFPIDIVYLDSDYRVIRSIEVLTPWRLSACRTARMTLELAARQANTLGLIPNMELQWQPA